ncbi:MAG: hypothetical protein LH609_23595 [Rudanella sp.]|nr:hypothetical protein [Rudanella sp.]
MADERQKQDKADLGTTPEKRRRGHAVRGTPKWEQMMQTARQQALGYVRALPRAEPKPLFVLVADVGYCLDVYSNFAGVGDSFVPFPDQSRYRIPMARLADEETRAMLRAIFTNPRDLDASRRAARVTRQLAGYLANLSAQLEKANQPDVVAQFLMRCLFTMFLEDVGLIPKASFTGMLRQYSESDNLREYLPDALQTLWQTMDTGGFSPDLKARLRRFNGKLFHKATALPLNADQMALLLKAAEADWTAVEPAIFGTLLERALDPRERHSLGAHYTPRRYVERLVLPTVLEPLRREWTTAQAAAAQLLDENKPKEARAELVKFLNRLTSLRILDPACGSGNFLYVTLEHLKRLEGEVLESINAYGPDGPARPRRGRYRLAPAIAGPGTEPPCGCHCRRGAENRLPAMAPPHARPRRTPRTNRTLPASLPPSTWLQAFYNLKTYIDALDKSVKKVVFLDEISWFDTPRAGFLAALDNFWNQYASKRNDVVLVICGSAASWIINKVVNDRGGLHNCITKHLRLLPFTLRETKAYLTLNNVTLTHKDITLLYICVGGVPFYLNDVRAGNSVPQLLDILFWGKRATLRNEFPNLYASLFKNHELHEQVVGALATKNKGLTRNEIITATGLRSGGGLSLVLQELIECGFVQQIYPINKNKEDSLFRLIDEFTNFYFRFLAGNKAGNSWLQWSNKPVFKIWAGYAFENLVFSHIDELKKALGISGVITHEYSWVKKGNDLEKGTQIDFIPTFS